ncbi:MAG: hypothetical protein PVI57_04355 [Gemmatimonadota bacterium]|jgi:hypothetical protein
MSIQERPRGTFYTLVGAVLLPLLGGLALAACGDDPYNFEWVAAPDTALLYSLARPESNLASGFNFDARRTIRIETPTATGTWDVALDTQDDQLVLLPPGALNVNSRARITTFPGMSFDDVREAPRDTAAYVADEPVVVEASTVYVVQTSQRFDTFGRRCVYFAKLEPVDIDVAAGTLRFLFDSNPVCNDRRLVPPGS